MSSAPIVVGRFGKSFGVSGWIKVISFTSPHENILSFRPWLIKINGSWEEISFENSKKQAKNIVVKLPGYDSLEEVARLTNIEIGVWHKQLPELPGGEYYWADLIGLDVINKEGISFGKVKEIIATGSNDVLIVSGDKKRLIPYTSDVIANIDLSNKIIQVDWEEDF